MHFTTIKHLFFSPAKLETLNNSKRLVHIRMTDTTAPTAFQHGQVQEEGLSVCLEKAEYILGAPVTAEDGKHPGA